MTVNRADKAGGEKPLILAPGQDPDQATRLAKWGLDGKPRAENPVERGSVKARAAIHATTGATDKAGQDAEHDSGQTQGPLIVEATDADIAAYAGEKPGIIAPDNPLAAMAELTKIMDPSGYRAAFGPLDPKRKP